MVPQLLFEMDINGDIPFKKQLSNSGVSRSDVGKSDNDGRN